MSSVQSSAKNYLPDGSDDFDDLCDVVLIADGQKFPAHGAFLGLHSHYFRRTIKELRKAKGASGQADGKLSILLDDSTSVEDVELMLAFVYGKRTALETADEASRLILLASKYDMPAFVRQADRKILELSGSLCFVDPAAGAKKTPRKSSRCLDAGYWLGVADTLGLDDLRLQCQYIIFRDMATHIRATHSRPELERAIASLDGYGVSGSSMAAVAAVLMELVARKEIDSHYFDARKCPSCGFKPVAPLVGGAESVECPSCARPVSTWSSSLGTWDTRYLAEKREEICDGLKKFALQAPSK
ncbi:unnamed protein product [Ostreobium quekettii]|uniref:BTB domain-containing protein n=1 Tax=Ostreobium quekettii TaxID=121088 RepID=A0A8S1IQN8_9CHLO|nr:unnamed protein product [Ostreobium quekettii]|eukprot:evm.model.scf_1358.3 EVM.evm.TU.scf_1358.3   scf_1358:38663-40084(-)